MTYKIYRATSDLALLGIKGWVCEDADGGMFIGRSAQEAFDHFRDHYGI